MDSEEVFVIGLGVLLVLVAFLVEIERKTIWKNYLKNYHPHDSGLLEFLLKPNVWVYRLNVYVVWPLVIVLGVWVIILNA